VYGLFDMVGNSWEWVDDWNSKSYASCGAACEGVDPRGPCAGEPTCASTRNKIVRGGSWYWEDEKATSVYRRAHVPNNEPFHHFGFRCAASADDIVALASSASTK
jgi:formylglycine-generating enzyme required for sulfatase activity